MRDKIDQLLDERKSIEDAAVAINKLSPPYDFDAFADAAEILARAAMRLAPEGHGIKVERW